LQPQFKKIFIFLDTEKHASPFDILTVMDTLPEAVIIKYEDVTAEDTEKILYDAMFPRGPEGAKHTKIFINGRNFELANEILARVKKCMFPPFELAVIIDPSGAYSTASAAVAKTLKILLERNWGTLKNKKVTVLAGTGPVGQTAAKLYASEKADVTITSRNLQKAESLATKINEELNTTSVQALQAQTSQEIGEAIEKAEIILSAGAGGTELLPLNTLKSSAKKCKIVADVNAIPPLGVAGLDPEMDGEEMLPEVYGVGALAVGRLKNEIEISLIRKAADEPKGIFDYKITYELAKISIIKKDDNKKIVVEPHKSWLP